MVTTGSSFEEDAPQPAANAAAAATAAGRLDLRRTAGSLDAVAAPFVILEEDRWSFARTIMRICDRLTPLTRLAKTPARPV
jgi:hypothetical protein